MNLKPPKAIAKAGIETGATKAKLSWDKALVPLAATRGRASNWIFAFLGNLAGAVIFVAAAYWYLYARPDAEAPDDTPSGAAEKPARVPVGGRA